MMTKTFRLTANSPDALQRAAQGIKNISFGANTTVEVALDTPKIFGKNFGSVSFRFHHDDDKDLELKALETIANSARAEAAKHGAQMTEAEHKNDLASLIEQFK
jgi:hypothetical protein